MQDIQRNNQQTGPSKEGNQEPKKGLHMPKSVERKIRKQGGVAAYRTIKRGGHTMTCAITKKAGPRGGYSQCWEKGKK